MSRSARVAEELWSSSLKGVRVFERGKFALPAAASAALSGARHYSGDDELFRATVEEAEYR